MPTLSQVVFSLALCYMYAYMYLALCYMYALQSHHCISHAIFYFLVDVVTNPCGSASCVHVCRDSKQGTQNGKDDNEVLRELEVQSLEQLLDWLRSSLPPSI